MHYTGPNGERGYFKPQQCRSRQFFVKDKEKTCVSLPKNTDTTAMRILKLMWPETTEIVNRYNAMNDYDNRLELLTKYYRRIPPAATLIK